MFQICSQRASGHVGAGPIWALVNRFSTLSGQAARRTDHVPENGMFTINRRELAHTLLIASLFMAIGLGCVDRMIGNPADFPTTEQG